jgi:xanthine dehydrogenase YagS FAD-binding subunit
VRALFSIDARDPAHAATLAAAARRRGDSVVYAGGGSDLLGMIKEGLVEPDVVVRLARMPGFDRVVEEPDGGLRLGGMSTLDALSRHAVVRERFTVLAEAAGSVGTPQIRNAATLAGNLCQRPWCWYYRTGFRCYKNGGDRCFAVAGENEHHAIFGDGPSHIVHPSDAAVALSVLGAAVRLVGPHGERTLAVDDFFTLPARDPARENVLEADELVAEVVVPSPPPGTRSAYHKVLDREAWTHAVVSLAVSVAVERGMVRRCRVALGGVAPVPWRMPRVERLVEGRPLTAPLAAVAGDLAVQGARPLAQNGYKVDLVRATVRRGLLALGA